MSRELAQAAAISMMLSLVVAGTRQPQDLSLCSMLFAADLILVGDVESTTSGPHAVATTMSEARRCGVPVDCVFFEIPVDIDLDQPATWTPQPDWIRRCLHADVVREMNLSHSEPIAVDYPVRRLDHLNKRLEAAGRLGHSDLGMEIMREYVVGRNHFMAERIARQRCERGLLLVGRAHLLNARSEPSTGLLAGDLAGLGRKVLVLDSRCTDGSSWAIESVHSVSGFRVGLAAGPCDRE